MGINWVVLTYFVVGVFALSGFYRGWWKEGLTTSLLVLLVFLLQQPTIAASLIALLNVVFDYIWSFSPDFFRSVFNGIFAITVADGQSFQLDANSPGTWLMIMLFLVLVTTMMGRYNSPGNAIQPMGSALGGLVGGLNGFILINLMREYLDGRGLPGGVSPTGGISLASNSAVGMASPGVALQATNLPRFTILDGWTPWMIIIIGLLILFSLLRTRYSLQGLKVNRKVPYGYK